MFLKTRKNPANIYLQLNSQTHYSYNTFLKQINKKFPYTRFINFKFSLLNPTFLQKKEKTNVKS
jgi:hypothetical protein